MPKRRANGEGNIRKRKDGRWEGRYTVGHDPETGKAIIKNVLGKTQAEVKEKLKAAIEENVGIDYGKAKNFTVGSWLEVWMENYAKIKLRPSTFKTSQGFLKNHIKPQIGSIPLADLTSLDLQRFYKHLLDGGRVDRIEAKKKPKGLAPKTVRNIHQMIGSAYNLAIEQKLVSRNPTQGCALPKVEHKEMKTLTADHGGVNNATFLQDQRIPAGIWNKKGLVDELNKSLKTKFNTDKDLVKTIMNYQVFFNTDIIEELGLDYAAIKQVVVDRLKKDKDVHYAFDMEKTSIESIPEELKFRAINGYNRERSGGVQIVLKPGHYDYYSSKGTTHGAWNPYDIHIPCLFMGWGIQHGESAQPHYMTDIAATVCAMLHIQAPNGCIGTPIF